MAALGEIRVISESETDLVRARQRGRELATEMGFSPTDATLIATAISEVARNILTYAGTGEIVISHVSENGQEGMVMLALDKGPGIEDVDAALQEGFSTAGGLGIGLPGARRLVDEFALSSETGKGTQVTMKKWKGHGGG